MRAINFRNVFVAACFAASLNGGPAHAQEVTAAVFGRVVDVNGRGIAGVQVTAQSASSITPHSTVTSPSGEYGFFALPPGPYVIGFTGSGLVTVKRVVHLAATTSIRADTVMRSETGTFDNAVTVTQERTRYPASPATAVDSRHADFDLLPLTGTVRSGLAFVTDLPGLRPRDSLFLLDGIPLRHGWFRSGAAFAGPGAETIQQVSVNPVRLPVAFGRLDQGVITVVTQPGAARFAGALRLELGQLDLNSDIPRLARETDGLGRSVEYGGGGPAIDNRLWFFASMRHVRQSVREHARLTGLPFTTGTSDRFGLGRLRFVPMANHRFDAHLIAADQNAEDATPLGVAQIADAGALESRDVSSRAFSVSYNGLARGLYELSARVTAERGRTAFTNASSTFPFVDRTTAARWLAPGSCAACDPQEARHFTIRATAATWLHGRYGAHHVMAGYDHARVALDRAGAPAEGTFEVWPAQSLISDGQIFPVLRPDGNSWIRWFPGTDRRLDVRSHSLFAGDTWIASPTVTVDVGLRLDANRVTDAFERPRLSERVLAPRAYATWRPSVDAGWTVTGGFGRYVPDPIGRDLDSTGAEVRTSRFFNYGGPPINAGGPVTSSQAAMLQVLNWFAAAGGPTTTPVAVAGAGRIDEASDRPGALHVDEWSVGVDHPIAQQGRVRADFTLRTWGGFTALQHAPGLASSESGAAVDTFRIVPAPDFERRYAGLTVRAKYRFGHYADVASEYTLSSLTGNADGGWMHRGVPGSGSLGYPEYIDPSWHIPAGGLPDDVRHRLRMWAFSEIRANETFGFLGVTVVHSRESGRPYGAIGLVDARPFVTNPGYLQPPPLVRYAFTAPDAYRAPGIARTDLALTYRRRLPGTVHGDLFAMFQILNVFGMVRVVNPELLVVTRTAANDPALQAFNPFIETPVEGVHWTIDDSDVRRATASTSAPRTLPRSFRVIFGVRF